MVPELRNGHRLSEAIAALRQEVMHAENVATGGGGLPLDRKVNRYLEWVSSAELRLRNHFDDPGVWQALHSDYFWRIRDLRKGSRRPAELIGDEARRQAERLEAIADALGRISSWVGRGPRVLAVLDTHVLLHFQPPQQVDWTDVVGADDLRLVIPLRVVEELDEKKYTARPDLADRARRLLSDLRARVVEAEESPIDIRDGVSLDFYLDDEPRRRTVDADQEVLETCIRLASTEADVRLVTDDAGLELRARARNVAVYPMPTRYLRKRR